MIIAMTGVSGNMGREALAQTMELEHVTARVLLTPKKKNDRLEKKLAKRYGSRITVVRGWLKDEESCHKLVAGVDLVVHMAAVIPPASDRSGKNSYECNYLGTVALVNAIKACIPQPKFIHVSTVALYGNRDEHHPWARVGDPLVVSPFDAYAAHKLAAERYVLEAGLEKFAVLRQTAMLYPEMMSANVSDGLMFHTAPNAPLEWSTSRDSGYLVKRIVERENAGEIDEFWYKIYNIGAGKRGRETGYDTFNDGFAMIGGSTEKFFKPCWFAQRNFHGVWFEDGGELEELFAYQRDGATEYWQEIANKHKIFALGKYVPKSLIHFFLFRRLLRHPNAPQRWLRNGDTARIQAYFGGVYKAAALPTKWEDFKLMARGDFGDYDEMRSDGYALEHGMHLSHGYDEEKPVSEWETADMVSAAKFRGGECLSKMKKGDLFIKLNWRCAEGHEFELTPFTVLKGGHWCPECCQPGVWRFDRVAKKSPFHAQVWYDSHDKSENFVYETSGDGYKEERASMREDVE